MRCPGRAFPYGYVFISLLTLGLGYLNVLDPRLGYSIRREDHLLESLTAAFFLLAVLALLAVAVRRQPWFPTRALYLLAAAGCLFVAGEEISWGQRLLGFATPDFFAGFNVQGETTFHNYNASAPAVLQFIASPRRLLSICLFPCLAVSVAYFRGRDKLLGVPLPSIPLLLAFLLTQGHLYERGFGIILDSGAHTLLLAFFLYGWLTRQGQLLLLTLAALVNLEAAIYIKFDLPNSVRWDYWEHIEFLLSACSLAYSLELLGHSYNRRRQEAPSPAKTPDGGGRRRAGGALTQPAWLLAGAFIIVASLSLVAWGYLKVRLATAQIPAVWQLVADGAAGEPFAKSRQLFSQPETGPETGLEVFLAGNRLFYSREDRGCSRWNEQAPVFLHLTPVNPDDLPQDLREHGYENRDFNFESAKRYRDAAGRCYSRVFLPDYPIAEIRTGQYETATGARLWEGRLLLDTGEYRDAYAAATANPPALRADFDIYLSGDSITYIKEPCEEGDTSGMFILHPFPVNSGYLPEWRQGQEFDNLDFQFDLRGARFDGKCVASIPLPDYPIDRLRVGQWLPDENRQLWQGEIPVGR